MRDYQRESLCYDPIHGYIPFVSVAGEGEVSERMLLDNPWVQRMRQIHQLQTAWWVYPSAEHTRFQHVVGAMHMASRSIDTLFDSLSEVCQGDHPSREYIEVLLRVSALLHDVGHGPFGHFFDAHFLKDFGLTHETLGAQIITSELADVLCNIRESPHGRMRSDEQLDPHQVAFLITRPKENDELQSPRWLTMLRSLFCGLYTVDNMDFVMRDAYMSGYSERAYDLERLLRYSFFSERGLTIHERGMNALVRFLRTRSELFRSIYYHRTVRAIDRSLEDLFRDSKTLLFPGNPAEELHEYLYFTEFSLLVDVARWHQSDDPNRRDIGVRWQALLNRQVDWDCVAERNRVDPSGNLEQSSIFSRSDLVEQELRRNLPPDLADVEFWIDVPRHMYRPHQRGATAGQNWLYSAATGKTRSLTDDELFRHQPVSHRICRLYLRKSATSEQAAQMTLCFDRLFGGSQIDDVTNM